mmetsp:Transcript_16843/g.35630  ORF Transcript_16843/g.35630 Transcript_16843/m.35630 type:complete len:106 (-) Transcript_16843:2-319(-)
MRAAASSQLNEWLLCHQTCQSALFCTEDEGSSSSNCGCCVATETMLHPQPRKLQKRCELGIRKQILTVDLSSFYQTDSYDAVLWVIIHFSFSQCYGNNAHRCTTY